MSALRADVVIVGAGLAGAATAFYLARRGVRDVLLLEREAAPGTHASGKNAGLVRRLVEEPMLDAVLEGAALLAAPPEELSRAPLVRRTGSIVIVPSGEGEAWAARAARVGARRLERGDLERMLPDVGLRCEGIAYHSPDDGVVEPREVLRAWLAAAERLGARVATGVAALSLSLVGGRVAGVETDRGRIEAGCVVDASGPWAGALARASGAAGLLLTSYRRHIHVARGRTWGALEAPAPYVWDTVGGFYVRPAPAADSGDASCVLLSPCDQGAVAPPASPAETIDAATAVVPERAEDLRRKLERGAPGLASLEVVAARACLRTFAADGRFAIGPDPSLPGLVYVAGLGGHGVTTSGPVGALGAAAVVAPRELPAEILPARLLGAQVRRTKTDTP